MSTYNETMRLIQMIAEIAADADCSINFINEECKDNAIETLEDIKYKCLEFLKDDVLDMLNDIKE